MTKKVKVNPAEEGWEIKDRTYVLRGDKNPLTYTIKSRHTEKYPLLYFDTNKNSQRALRYATNQSSCFTDEQKGEVTMGHIIFRDGFLKVPKDFGNYVQDKGSKTYHGGNLELIHGSRQFLSKSTFNIKNLNF